MFGSPSVTSRPACPRSAYDQILGLIYFPRMLDKIRLHAAGRLPADYHENLGIAMDGRCCRLLGVTYQALQRRVLEGGSDEQIFVWCTETGRRPTEEEIMIWNCFARKRGWRDGEDGATAALEKFKAGSGLGQRHDLVTIFDYYEADEGREPKPPPRLTATAPVLLVADVRRAAEYFRDCLGFQFDRYWGEPADFCMPRRDGLTVMLSQVSPRASVTPHWKVVDKMWNAYFWVSDAAALYGEFQQRGAIIDYTLGVKPYDVLEFGIQDPDGHDIGFGQPVPPGYVLSAA